jgi:hypothetical protein
VFGWQENPKRDETFKVQLKKTLIKFVQINSNEAIILIFFISLGIFLDFNFFS